MIKILFYLKRQRAIVLLSVVLLLSCSIIEVSEEPSETGQTEQSDGAEKTTEKTLNPEDRREIHRKFRRGELMRGGDDEGRRDREEIQWCRHEPKFRETPGPLVGIVSFPGSGNTWVRYLLQQMTGTLTGSVYDDGDLRRNGFKGETHRSGKALVVKTHEWGPSVRSTFSAGCLLLVRDPLESLLSEYNRQAGGHTGHARDLAGLNNFVKKKLENWRNLNLDWLQNFSPSRLLVVSYSQLRTDLRSQLLRMTAFLNLTVTEEVLNCTIKGKEGVFRRKKISQNVIVTQQNLKLLSQSKTEVVRAATKIYGNFVL